jgi:hypothetical protein
MIESLPLYSTLFQLCAEWRKARVENTAEFSAAEFQNWLTHEAFPELLKNSEQILASVVSMKATQSVKLELILNKLDEISALLDSGSNDQFLEDIHWDMLRILSEACTDSLFRPFDHAQIAQHLNIEKSSSLEAATLLENFKYLKIISSTKSRVFRITAKGYLKHQSTLGVDASGRAKRIAAQLPTRNETKRAGAIAENAEASIVLVEAMLRVWSEQDLIRLEAQVYPFSQALVLNVKPILLKDERLQSLSYLSRADG